MRLVGLGRGNMGVSAGVCGLVASAGTAFLAHVAPCFMTGSAHPLFLAHTILLLNPRALSGFI